MTQARPTSVKHVFLDIVGFTKNRSVEDQTFIIDKLNDLVREVLKGFALEEKELILLPTGDGMCVVFVEVPKPKDIHMQFALRLLEGLDRYNSDVEVPSRSFEVRVGVNANDDNIFTDINNDDNVAGRGINMAQRIMNIGDGNQVLVGNSVYDRLLAREPYVDKFRRCREKMKHGEYVTAYQYIGEGHRGLNTEVPTRFRQEVPKLTPLVAYYMAHSLSIESFLLKNGNNAEYAGIAMLYFRGVISELEWKDKDQPYDPPVSRDSSLEEELAYYRAPEFIFRMRLARIIINNVLYPYRKCFQSHKMSYWFVNEKGKTKLKEEWPEVWEQVLSGDFVTDINQEAVNLRDRT